jgi:hypothetical protein
MTFQLIASLDCDAEPCSGSFRLLPGETLNEARKRARSRGWGVNRVDLKSRSIVRDFCPTHKEK